MLALNLVAAALQKQEQVLYLSLEMTRRQLQNRMAAILTRTPVNALEKGDSQDTERMLEAGRLLVHADTSPLWTNPEPENALARLVDTMLDYQSRGCRLFVLDYLQLIRGAKNERDLYDRVTEVSMTLRQFASSRSAIILALSQLNRQATSQRVEAPMIHQLAGGSPLENDSDQVVILDHTRYQQLGDRARTWLILGKNRHGPTGQIAIEWDYRYLTVREALPDEVDDWPTHGK